MVRTLRKYKWKLIAFCAVILLMGVEGIFLTADHWWKALREASVTVQSQIPESGEVYQSISGDILVRLKEQGTPSLYVISPSRRLVGMANPTRFIFIPGYAYSRDMPPVYPLMQSAKIEVDPGLVVHQGTVEFNSFDNERIRITW